MLQIQNISFGYTDKVVIHSLTFQVNQGQNVALLGESGCGKSIILKLIYGLYDLNFGNISWNETTILGPKNNLIPRMDFIKYLAQDFDLMPHISVAENIGKYLSNTNSIQKNDRIKELLEIVEMTDYANEKPKNLSGGQQQRVAIARVLAIEPSILLLDEPFSHIDNSRKNALRRNLFAYLKNKNITCIVATHDSTDALSFSDKTIIIQDGKIVQNDDSKMVYQNPSSKYVGSLYGEVNELKQSQLGILNDNATDETVFLYSYQLKIDLNGFLKVRVRNCYFKGNHYLVKAALGKQVIFFEHVSVLPFNEEVQLSTKKKRLCSLFNLVF